MSKQVKKMQMDALANTFRGVRDMLFLSVQGIDAITENRVRLGLRKKNISLMMVKNSLLRRVFAEVDLKPNEEAWVGTTVVAWGGESVKHLSKEIESAILKDPKLRDKARVKTAMLEGQAITFAQALTMPSRLEAIGEIVAAMFGPATAIAGALVGPASQIASQLQTISERKPEEEASPAA